MTRAKASQPSKIAIFFVGGTCLVPVLLCLFGFFPPFVSVLYKIMLLDGLDMHITYATYDAMSEDGAVRRGWIPEWVPESATDFEESHNLDTNRSWLRFSVPAEDIDAVVDALTPVAAAAVQFPKKPPLLSALWWPDDLTGLSAGAGSYEFFQHEKAIGGIHGTWTYLVAIDRSSNTVWRWRA